MMRKFLIAAVAAMPLLTGGCIAKTAFDVVTLPVKATSHPVETFLSQAHVLNYRPHPFMRDFWRYIDIDAGAAH